MPHIGGSLLRWANNLSSDSDDANARDYYAMAAKHGDIEAEQEAYEEMP